MNRLRAYLAVVCASLVVGGCSHSSRVPNPDLAQIRADIAYFSSPEMEGRAPGGIAELPVSGYFIDRFEQSGLQPAFTGQSGAMQGGWSQRVTLYRRSPLKTEAKFTKNGRVLAMPPDRISLIGTQSRVAFDNAKLLFLGRGDGNAIAQMDLSNTVVLINAAKSDSDRVSREAKFAKAGALGVIEIVRGPEGYTRLASQQERPHFFLPPRAADAIAGIDRTSFNGIMGEERAVALISLSGKDWDKIMLRSALPSFKGEWINAQLDLTLNTVIEPVESRNVGGVIRGKKPGSGALLYMAHWDHLGHCVALSGLPDVVCPGAVDNASGLAALLHIAEILGEKTHDRDIYFVATTGEEHSFIGARTLLAQSPIPPTDYVAIFNLDMVAVAPAGTPVAVIGWDGGKLDQIIAEVMRGEGLAPSDNVLAATFLKRQDGWVFTEAGYPARMINSSYGDEAALNNFIAGTYHSPTDRFSPAIELSGAAQDIRLHIALGQLLANRQKYP